MELLAIEREQGKIRSSLVAREEERQEWLRIT